MINVIIVLRFIKEKENCKFNVYSIFSLCVIMCLIDFMQVLCHVMFTLTG